MPKKQEIKVEPNTDKQTHQPKSDVAPKTRGFSVLGFVMVIFGLPSLMALSGAFAFYLAADPHSPLVQIVYKAVKQLGLSNKKEVAYMCIIFYYLWTFQITTTFQTFSRLVATGGNFNNSNPRAQKRSMTGITARFQAAHENSLEMLAPFILAVVLAMTNQVAAGIYAHIAVLVCGLRVLYTFLYVVNLDFPRSFIWMTMLWLIIILLVIPLYPTFLETSPEVLFGPLYHLAQSFTQ